MGVGVIRMISCISSTGWSIKCPRESSGGQFLYRALVCLKQMHMYVTVKLLIWKVKTNKMGPLKKDTLTHKELIEHLAVQIIFT